MRRFLSVLVLAGLLTPLWSLAQVEGDLSAPSPAVEGREKKVKGQYIVIFKEGVDVDSLADELPRKHKGKALQIYKHALKGMAIGLSDRAAEELAKDPRIELLSPDFEVSAFGKNGGGDVTIQAQTLPTGIDRANAENKANKGAGVEVAVIDTGIDLNHPDLKANILGGKACNGSGYGDQNGHGTHVAGTIAAVENTVGVVGVAPKAKLWAVRVLNAQGSGTWSQVICGIDWVTANASHIKVANMSLGGGGTSGTCASDALHRAICNSVSAGVTYVVAAGNNGADLKGFTPAAYPEVIAVTALADSNGKACGGGAATSYGADDTFASFSNYATLTQDLARTIGAPGVSIYSTYKNRSYARLSGTSMASPHVAGAAALYLAANPGATPAQVKAGLLAAAEPVNVNMNGECTAPAVSHLGLPLHPEPVLRAESF